MTLLLLLNPGDLLGTISTLVCFLSVLPQNSVFYGLCGAVQWPPSHPGATQPVQDSGAQGPCQNLNAPHLQSINASHSHSPTPSPTLPRSLAFLYFAHRLCRLGLICPSFDIPGLINIEHRLLVLPPFFYFSLSHVHQLHLQGQTIKLESSDPDGQSHQDHVSWWWWGPKHFIYRLESLCC